MRGPGKAVVGSSGDDAIASRDRLVTQIVGQIDRQGYFMTQVPAHPPQGIVDLRWAVQGAGRAIGRRMHTYVTEADARLVGLVTVIAAPVDASAAIDELLRFHTGLLQSAPISA